MLSLEHKHPGVLQQFQSGKFVVFKSSHIFSAIDIDHAHEQANVVIKCECGAIGMTEDHQHLEDGWFLDLKSAVLLQNMKLYQKLKT